MTRRPFPCARQVMIRAGEDVPGAVGPHGGIRFQGGVCFRWCCATGGACALCGRPAIPPRVDLRWGIPPGVCLLRYRWEEFPPAPGLQTLWSRCCALRSSVCSCPHPHCCPFQGRALREGRDRISFPASPRWALPAVPRRCPRWRRGRTCGGEGGGRGHVPAERRHRNFRSERQARGGAPWKCRCRTGEGRREKQPRTEGRIRLGGNQSGGCRCPPSPCRTGRCFAGQGVTSPGAQPRNRFRPAKDTFVHLPYSRLYSRRKGLSIQDSAQKCSFGFVHAAGTQPWGSGSGPGERGSTRKTC